MNNSEKLISIFKHLPPNKQEEVIDFASYLEEISLDSTKYLFSTKSNKKHLVEAIENVESGKNLIKISLEDLEKGNLPNI